VVDAEALPPVPVHESVYVLVALSAPVDCVPLVPLVPDQAPDAVQLVALVELHVSVELPPLATETGLAVSVTVGTEDELVTVTVFDAEVVPPEPVHESV
jgi:hypothetical protein